MSGDNLDRMSADQLRGHCRAMEQEHGNALAGLTAQTRWEAAMVKAEDRIAELELALKDIRAKAKFEQEHPTGLEATCLSLIEKTATLALAGVDTYDSE